MQFNINMDKELEMRFREKAMKRFEYKQGALKKAVEEAIEEWLAAHTEEQV